MSGSTAHAQCCSPCGPSQPSWVACGDYYADRVAGPARTTGMREKLSMRWTTSTCAPVVAGRLRPDGHSDVRVDTLRTPQGASRGGTSTKLRRARLEGRVLRLSCDGTAVAPYLDARRKKPPGLVNQDAPPSARKDSP